MHTTLDSFVAGPKGEISWVNVDEEIFDFVGTMTDQADTAVYGRVTYEMMQSYWPDAGNEPDASKHDKEHSAWYNKVSKVVLSKTLREQGLNNTAVISDQLAENINKIKEQDGKNMLIFGSPTAAQSMLNQGLIDEFWLFVNPVILGQGVRLFADVTEMIKLKLVETKTFSCGVVALHYETKRS